MSEYLFGDAKATARSIKKTDLATMLEEARVAYEGDRKNGDLALHYAELLNRANNPKDSYEIYKGYIEGFSANQEIMFEVALLAKMLEYFDEAKELFKRAIEMAPGNSLARSAEYELWSLNGGGKLRWSKED